MCRAECCLAHQEACVFCCTEVSHPLMCTLQTCRFGYRMCHTSNHLETETHPTCINYYYVQTKMTSEKVWEIPNNTYSPGVTSRNMWIDKVITLRKNITTTTRPVQEPNDSRWLSHSTLDYPKSPTFCYTYFTHQTD